MPLLFQTAIIIVFSIVILIGFQILYAINTTKSQ